VAFIYFRNATNWVILGRIWRTQS